MSVVPCATVDPLLRGSIVIRSCLENGTWSALDYTGCALGLTTTDPFALIWFLVETSDPEDIVMAMNMLENEVM